MAAENNLTVTLAKAQSIDMAETFGQSVKKLVDLLGVTRKTVLPVGSTIKTYKSKVTLAGGTVDKGDEIPLSKVDLTEGTPIELKWDKRRKAVSAEDIQKYGFEQAISNTDTKLIKEVQSNIKKGLFTQLDGTSTTVQEKGLQATVAKCWGKVIEKFDDDEVRVIGFIHPLDVATYLSNAGITTQNAFGLKFVEDFLGFDMLVITSAVASGTLYATAADNLVLAYADLANGELAKTFDFITDETGIVGVTHNTNKTRLTSETIIASASVLYAEVLDGVVKATIQPLEAGPRG